MKIRKLIAVLVFSTSLIGSGCSSLRPGEGDVRTAVDTPEQFNAPAGMAWGANTCLNPIIDPADGTELILIQSMDGLGDYRVTGGKYGVNTGELLRINCRTGEVVGIVRGR
jgi:hypothetical protein